MPHIGHGLGVGLHENPMINPFNERKLELNMVVNIEPLLVDNENQACYHLEDLVLCQEDGPRILTGDILPHKLPIII
jgi:Xaa-Pro aminopeptidase